MIRAEVLRKRLEKLGEYIAILCQLQEVLEEEFVNDPQKYGAAERFLQLAIEVTLDMGNYVISGLQGVRVDTYRNTPKRFYEQGYVNKGRQETC